MKNRKMQTKDEDDPSTRATRSIDGDAERCNRKLNEVQQIGGEQGDEEELHIESTNATSANTNKLAILESDAHIQFIQETCLTKALQASFEKEAREYKKLAIGSPLDPEHIKATAGVAAIAVQTIKMYPVPNPTEDYKDAEKTGRCKIICTDIGGHTLACANIYGWSGGVSGSMEAERTDDVLAIIRMLSLIHI